MMQYCLTVPKNGNILDLKESLKTLTTIDPNMVIVISLPLLISLSL